MRIRQDILRQIVSEAAVSSGSIEARGAERHKVYREYCDVLRQLEDHRLSHIRKETKGSGPVARRALPDSELKRVEARKDELFSMLAEIDAQQKQEREIQSARQQLASAARDFARIHRQLPDDMETE